VDANQFLKTTVILPVGDIQDTTRWYETALGFRTTYVHGQGRRGENPNFANYAIMTCDAIEVHFILDEGGPVWTRAGTGHLALTVRDVDVVYAAVRARGIPIARELQQENWPARGFTVLDPSGNDVHVEQFTG
jgi:catechol 2,3-dioxygenase-like lactoylglutathione lyase family enzyme